MTEFAFSKKISIWLGITEEEYAVEPAPAGKDDFWIDPNIRNQRVSIEGLGEIQITPQGSFLLNSAQFLKLSQYETDKGLPHAASKSLENGSFLVSFPVSKSDTV